MRQFIVLGFTDTSAQDTGKLVHLGSDRGESLAVLKEDDGRFVRKELYELAVPHVSRHFETSDQQKPVRKKSDKKKPTE